LSIIYVELPIIIIGGNNVPKVMGLRQDGWDDSNDELLAKTVIEFVQSGKTQLLAFEEVAKLLDRTAQACGFRWNSSLRKQYNQEMKEAKKQKSLLPSKKYYNKKVVSIQERMPLSTQQILEMMHEFFNEYEQLKQENASLKKVKVSEDSLHFSADDVQTMTSLFKRARDQNILDDGNQSKSAFKMDRNGNLERV
jgi:prespore-specific regulator